MRPRSRSCPTMKSRVSRRRLKEPPWRRPRSPRQGPMLTTATLTIWLYDTAMGAAAGEVRLKDLQRRGAVRVVDALTVTWVPGADRPHIGHLLRRGPAAAAKGTALGALV